MTDRPTKSSQPHARESSLESRLTLATWALIAIALGLTLWTYTDFGVTWDEVAHLSEGEKALNYYEYGLDERFAASWTPYGGLYHGSLALVPRLFPGQPEWEVRHLFNALVTLFGVLGCAGIGTLLGGAGGGFLATLLMLSFPVYMGHAFSNYTDTPFAVGYVWAIYFLLHFVLAFPRVPMAIAVALGIVIGCTAAIRVGGLILLGYLGLAFLALVVLSPERERPDTRAILSAALRVGVASVVAYGVMVAFWPWAIGDPLVRPFKSLLLMDKASWIGQVLFEGRIIQSADLPWRLPLSHLAIQTPELHWLAAFATLPLLLRSLTRLRVSRSAFAITLLLFVCAFPVVFGAVRGVKFFDSFRHFLFIVPPLIALIALGLLQFLRDFPKARLPAIAALGAAFALVAFDFVSLHPYQYAYYSRISGGLPAAWDRYETDYWGASYKELVETLSDTLPPDETVRVYIDGPFANARPFLPAHFEWVRAPGMADVILTLTRTRAHLKWHGEELARVERHGVPFSLALRAQIPGMAPERPAAHE